MPRAEIAPANVLVDTWGRQNRSLPDRICPTCRATFRPLRSASRFCSRPCMWAQNGGQNRTEETWWVSHQGYVIGRIWEGGKQRHVKQHRLVIERLLGRRLGADEDVHHINGDKADNRIENLRVLSKAEHSRISNAHRWDAARAAIARATGEAV